MPQYVVFPQRNFNSNQQRKRSVSIGGLGWVRPTPAQHVVRQGTGVRRCIPQLPSRRNALQVSGLRPAFFYSSFASLAGSGADVISITSCRSGLGAAGCVCGGEQRFDTDFAAAF